MENKLVSAVKGGYFEHFKERLLLRYGLSIVEEEYDELCLKFVGLIRKNSSATFGFVIFNEKKIYCHYNSNTKTLNTCYPKEVETNIDSLIWASIPFPTRRIAKIIYEDYVAESKSVLKNFSSNDEVANYFFENTKYPKLHIYKHFTGKEDLFKVVKTILEVINGESKTAQIHILKIN